MWKVIFCVVLVFFSAGVIGEECSDLDIVYVSEVIRFGRTVQFFCNLQVSAFKWWRSSAPCGDFVPYNDCNQTHCDVLLDDSIQRYFYYCCTAEDVAEITQLVSKECFNLQICTNITSTGPEIALFGSTQMISVSMYAQPPPVSIEITAQLDYANNSTSLPAGSIQEELVSLPQDVTRLIWVYTVEVVDVEEDVLHGNLIFTASYTRPDNNCPSVSGASRITYNITVARSNRQQPSSTTTKDVTTESTTSEPIQPQSIDCTPSIVAAVIVSVLLVAVIVVIIVLCVIYFFKRSRKNISSTLETSNVRTRPDNFGSTRTGRHGYTSVPNVSATPTPVTPHHERVLATIDEEVESQSTTVVNSARENAPQTPRTPNTPLPRSPVQVPYARVHSESTDQQQPPHIYDTAGPDSSAVIENETSTQNEIEISTQSLQNGNGTASDSTWNENETVSDSTQNEHEPSAMQSFQNGNETTTLISEQNEENETTSEPMVLHNEHVEYTTLPNAPTLDAKKDSSAHGV